MSGSLNKVILIGRLGQDPEIVSMNDGGKIVKFSLATSERWKDRSTGEPRERTEWHRIVIFNENIGRVAEQYLRKGSQVCLEGQIQTRKWQDQNGLDRYTTEIVLARFRGELTMLGGRNDQSDGGSGGGYNNNNDYNNQGGGNQDSRSQSSSQSSSPPPQSGNIDDDIPF